MSDKQSHLQYVEVDPSAAAKFFGSPESGPVVMLNLIRFRAKADYAHAPDLEPEGGIDGATAYRLYMDAIEPKLEASGGKVLFAGSANKFLIGPQDETWDFAMLVKQSSKASFMAFASDPEAQRITAHRTAAVADSRLLPIQADSRFA